MATIDSPAAANALATLGAVCWSIQLIPQIVINYRRHHATGLQPSMMMLWAWAGVPLGIYNIVSNFTIALQIQPQILTTLSLVTWAQCYHYQRRWHPLRTCAYALPLICLMAGIEVGLVSGLRSARDHGVTWPLKVCAVLAAALLAAGVLRHYYDIWVHRHVRGISFLFVSIDAAGDVFSLASLFFEPRLDVLGCVIYGTEFVLWLGILSCGVWYNLPGWWRGVKEHREERHEERREEQSQAENPGPGEAPMLHEMSSSTSVFRTPSSEIVARTVSTITRADGRSHGLPAIV